MIAVAEMEPIMVTYLSGSLAGGHSPRCLVLCAFRDAKRIAHFNLRSRSRSVGAGAVKQNKMKGKRMAVKAKRPGTRGGDGMTTQAILDQINELFGDTSVSKQTTLDALEEIQTEIEFKIVALKEDIKRDE